MALSDSPRLGPGGIHWFGPGGSGAYYPPPPPPTQTRPVDIPPSQFPPSISNGQYPMPSQHPSVSPPPQFQGASYPGGQGQNIMEAILHLARQNAGPSLAHMLAAAAAAHPQMGVENSAHSLGKLRGVLDHLPHNKILPGNGLGDVGPGGPQRAENFPAQAQAYPQLRGIAPGLARAAAY